MTWEDWFPVFTLVLGSLLTIMGGAISEWYKNRWIERKEQRDRSLQEIKDQRDTLLRLQASGADLLNAVDDAYDCKLEKFRSSGAWNENLVDQDIRARRRQARILSETLRVLIRDEELRTLSGEVVSLESRVTDATSEIECTDALSVMRQRFVEANERLGAIIRGL
jgi:hypothetical protein